MPASDTLLTGYGMLCPDFHRGVVLQWEQDNTFLSVILIVSEVATVLIPGNLIAHRTLASVARVSYLASHPPNGEARRAGA